MFKKLLLSFFVFLTIFFSVVPLAHAQGTGQWYNQDFSEWYTKVYGSPESEIFGERYTAAQVQWILYSFFAIPFKVLGPDLSVCLISGDIGGCLNPLFSSAQNINTQTSIGQSSNGTLLGAIFADRPMSGVTYFKNVIRRFHLIPEAQAQTQAGFGFNALEPTLNLWRGSRNVAYALLVLITVILSFMIMFRVKISPQVAISVQSALPKLAITVVLVTFSYAIAGFLIDLMYVTIGLVSLALKSYFPVSVNTIQIFNFLTKGQPFGVNAGVSILGLFVLFVFLFLFTGAAVFLTAAGGIITIIAAAFAAFTLLTPGLNTLVLLLVALIILIVFVLLLYHFFRVLWMLLKAFVNVLLLTIFAPFHLILGALIPSMGFGTWVKSFASNLLVFVITGALFLLAYIFLNQALLLSVIDVIDDPSIVGNLIFGTAVANVAVGGSAYWPPLLSWGGGGAGANVGVAFLFWAASFAIFAIIPKTAEIIQSFVQGKPFSSGSAIGEATTGLIGPAAKTVTFVQQAGPPIRDRLTSLLKRAGTPSGPQPPGTP
jgi:hypothetical protein